MLSIEHSEDYKKRWPVAQAAGLIQSPSFKDKPPTALQIRNADGLLEWWWTPRDDSVRSCSLEGAGAGRHDRPADHGVSCHALHRTPPTNPPIAPMATAMGGMRTKASATSLPTV